MKQSNSFTFDLIKSLSPSEKSYIKKNISYSGKHLVDLFNDLNKASIYDKKCFSKKNEGKAYLNNLSQNKNYLSKKIIDALISYRSKTIVEIETYNYINEIYILIDKKFFNRAKTMIEKLLREALYVENYSICYSLVGIILQPLNNDVHFKLSTDEIYQYKKRRRFYLKQLTRIETINELNDLHYNNKDGNTANQLKAYEKKFESLCLLNIEDLPDDYPFHSKRTFYFSKSLMAKLLNQTKDDLYNIKKVVNLYKNHSQFIPYYSTQFLGDCVNFLNSLIRTGENSTFLTEQKNIVNLINKFENHPNFTNNGLLYVIQFYLPQTVINNGRFFDKAIKSTKEYLEFIKNNTDNLSSHFKTVSFTQISLTFLYTKHYEKALENHSLSINRKNYSNQYLSRIITILAHYALKNDLLLDHLFQSFINYLKSANKKEQIPNIRKFKKHTKTKTVHLLKNEDFEDFVYIHWDLFEQP